MDKLIIPGRVKGTLVPFIKNLSDSGVIKDAKSYDVKKTRDSSPIEIEVVRSETMSHVQFDDGTFWIGATEEVDQLFKKQSQDSKDNVNRGLSNSSLEDTFEVPTTISTPSNERGLVKDLAVQFFSYFKPVAIDLSIVELASRLDRYFVSEEGLKSVDSQFNLSNKTFKTDQSTKPYLLLIHGTNSSTLGSFENLNNQGERIWNKIHKEYEGRTIAFDHHTLRKSPLQNAVELVRNLPDEIELHLLTHSRGGLIGDILARFAHFGDGFTRTEHTLLENADRTTDIEAINAIRKEVADRNITVSKYIRVACPAEGTELLSSKLNVFFNVLVNLTRFAPSVAGQAIHNVADTILQIIKKKDDPASLPGLEAMIATSPFNLILNNKHQKLNGQLSIISAKSNIRGGFLKGVAYVLSNLIQWQPSDFVVDTDSMYGGTPRALPYRHLRVSSDSIHHLSYFEDTEVQSSIYSELKGNEQNNKFKPKIDLQKERGVLGIPGGKMESTEITGTRPIVILIPGIMGSVLSDKENDNTHWLNFLQIAKSGATRLSISPNELVADSLIKSSYYKLSKFLYKNGYDVFLAPYDWRLSLADSGKELAGRINTDILPKLGSTDLSINVIAHSMGGLVMRDIMANHPATYKKISNRPGFKFIMLGTPWNGSHLIMQFLAGQGKIFSSINKLAFFTKSEKLLETFSTLPGIMHLLPKTTSNKSDFADIKSWKDIINLHAKSEGRTVEDLKWRIPEENALSSFRNYISKLPKEYDFDNVIYIAGKSELTVHDYYFDKSRTPALRFIATPKGDGSVTWESGIPNNIKNLYYVETSHGALSQEKDLFKGYLELLRRGKASSALFSKEPPPINVLRGETSVPAHPPVSAIDEELEMNIMQIDAEPDVDSVSAGSLAVQVTCGDLRKSNHPVMVGHIRGAVLQGAEKAVNYALEGGLHTMLRLGLYPNERETSEFMPGNDQSNFKGAIIIGVGAQENITGYVLERSVEKAVLKYVLKLVTRSNSGEYIDLENIGLSTVLMSSYYGKLNIESSIESILKGVNNARQILKEEGTKAQIKRLEFVEIYEDKAQNAFLTLKRIDRGKNEFFIDVADTIVTRAGSRIRLPAFQESEFYQRYTVTLSEIGKKNIINVGEFSDLKETDEDAVFMPIRGLRFRSYAGLAREEMVDDYTNHHLIESLVADVPDNKWNKRLSKTLFELLIPNAFKTSFKRQSNILLILDKMTAQYPWEMLAPDLEQSEPLCVTASMIRQFSTSEYRESLHFVSQKNAFLIGNPDTDGEYVDLPGAGEEVNEIATLLSDRGYDIDYDPNNEKSSADYIMDLFSNEYRFIHISAHGIYDEQTGISKIITGPRPQDVITTADLTKLNYTPELAFINCCHLGKSDNEKEELFKDRYKIAASIGLELLRNGYKMVIVAGWAINDQAAKVFATAFYSSLLNGKNFGESVREGRRQCYNQFKSSNTWGAYQCYGDPNYTLPYTSGQSAGDGDYDVPLQAKIDLRRFRNDVISKSNKTLDDYFDNLVIISDRIANSNFSADPEILELEANCYASILKWDKALSLYTKLFEGNQTYTFSAHEQYGNITARNALINMNTESIHESINLLKKLTSFGNTQERHALLASAYKRLCMLQWDKKVLASVEHHYLESFKLADHSNYKTYFYPLLAYMTARYFRLGRTKLTSTITKYFDDQIELESLLNKLKTDLKKIQISDNFWDEIALISLHQYQFIISKDENKCMELIVEMKKIYRRAWKLGGTPLQRESELDHIQFLILGIKHGAAKLRHIKHKSLLEFQTFIRDLK